jgi:hypothetical protein
MRSQFSEFLESSEIFEYTDNNHSQIAGGQGELADEITTYAGAILVG